MTTPHKIDHSTAPSNPSSHWSPFSSLQFDFLSKAHSTISERRQRSNRPAFDVNSDSAPELFDYTLYPPRIQARPLNNPLFSAWPNVGLYTSRPANINETHNGSVGHSVSGSEMSEDGDCKAEPSSLQRSNTKHAGLKIRTNLKKRRRTQSFRRRDTRRLSALTNWTQIYRSVSAPKSVHAECQSTDELQKVSVEKSCKCTRTPILDRQGRFGLRKVRRRWSAFELYDNREIRANLASEIYRTARKNALGPSHPEERQSFKTFFDVFSAVERILTMDQIAEASMHELITPQRERDVKMAKETSLSEFPRKDEDPAKITSISTSETGEYAFTDEAFEAYLITNHDIDVIFELLRSFFLRGNSRDRHHTGARGPSRALTVKSSTFTDRGLVLGTGAILESKLTPTEVQLRLGHCQDPSPLFPPANSCVIPVGKSTIPQTNAQEDGSEEKKTSQCGNSVCHGISSLQSQLSLNDTVTFDQPCDGQSRSNCTRLPSTIDQTKTRKISATTKTHNEGRYQQTNAYLAGMPDFDSVFSNSDEVMKRRLSTRSVSEVEESSKLITQEPQSVTSFLGPIKTRRSDSLEDVLSFPPLPSRLSNEWKLPLPPMDSPVSITPLPSYDMNMTTDVEEPIPRALSSQSSRTSWIRRTECSLRLSRVPSVVFDPGYEIKQARRGRSLGTIGKFSNKFSIADHRAIESVSFFQPGLSRVSTIDSIDVGKRDGTWTRARPPSIYPPPVSPSSGELSDASMPPSPRRNAVVANSPSRADSYFSVSSQALPEAEALETPLQEALEQLWASSRRVVDNEAQAHICDDCFAVPTN